MSGGPADEVGVPKAPLNKLILELLPEDVRCAPDTRELIVQCVTEFVHLLAAEASEIATKGKKKVMAPEHVVSALQMMCVACLRSTDRHVVMCVKFQSEKGLKDRPKSRRLEDSGISEEDMMREQQALFERARLATGMALPPQEEPQEGSGSGAT